MNALFVAGDRVRVSDRNVAGHTRTPRYVRGKRGVVERSCGAYANPEELAYGNRSGARVPLYRVRFALADVWDERGDSNDTVDVELYEHWLERDEGA